MQELAPILVAEDDEDDFFFLRRAVRNGGVENPLLRFRDGSELIKFLEQIPAAEMGASARSGWLLLLDITMPVVNGFEVLGWIASHKGMPRLRPVMLSASYRPDDIERAMALGAVDYLVKPVTPQVIASVVAKQLTPSLQR
jgi:CheY-like chemotaxis protein